MSEPEKTEAAGGKQAMIVCENLVKIYKTDDIEVVALQGLDLTVEEGELMAIVGNSGSGKSTLLNMIGALDRPSAGRLYVNGIDLFRLTEKQTVLYKRDTVGFVWQNNARNLIPYLTARENVEYCMSLQKRTQGGADRARELLDMAGILHRENNRLSELSGGEQQRVAIAIALCHSPRLLLADEPTGSVDSKTSGQILELFRRLNRELSLTVVIVTHDRAVSRSVDRVVAIRDGRTSSETIRRVSYAEELAALENGLQSPEDTREELAVLDRAGRLQIPQEYLAALGLTGKNKVRIELEGDRIVLVRPQTPGA